MQIKKQEKENKLNESKLNEILDDQPITEELVDKVVTYIINQNRQVLNENEVVDIDEGILAKVIGALGGATIGNKILVKISEMLGLKKDSILYNLLTSKVFSGTLGAFVADNVLKGK